MNEEQRKKTNDSIFEFIEQYFSSEEQKDPAMVVAIAELLRAIYQSSK